MRACILCLLAVAPAFAFDGSPYTDPGYEDDEIWSRFEIVGLAQGGTVSLRDIWWPGTGKLLTVETVAGETPAQIVAKLVAKVYESYESCKNSPFHTVRVSVDGQTLLIRDGPACLKTTDPGIETVDSVSSPTARAIKAEGKVILSWTLPSPPPEEIIIIRNNFVLDHVSGTANTYEDTNFDDASYPLSYTIFCQASDSQGQLTRYSDIAQVHSTNPTKMEDDVFRVTTTQEFVPGAVKGTEYSATLSKNGGTSPVSWSLESGNLPDGLVLTTVGLKGEVSGTPTATGTWTFTARVTDATGATATKALSITVTEYPIMGYALDWRAYNR